MRRLTLVAALGAAALAGCYGSTEPATNVGPESATLNGQGTADNGPAQSWFQYWLTGTQRTRREATAAINWPAGASGPISQKATRLTAAAQYTFQLCGRDQGGPTRCAQGRHFTTKPAVEDSLFGRLEGGHSRVDIDARSGPTGASPRGNIAFIAANDPNPVILFNGIVTCLAVNGSRAAVGAVGKYSSQGTPDRPATWLVTIEDRRTVVDTYNQTETSGSTPPNCAGADWSHQGELTDGLHEFIVNDAAP